MGNLDKDLQKRVWQRVQAAPGNSPPPLSPEGLLLDELTDRAQMTQMGWRELADQAGERAAILRGICRIAGLPEPALRPKGAEQGGAVVRRLMGRLLRRQREYARLSDHEEFGILYAALGQLTAESCVQLAKQTGTSPLRK